MFANAYHCQGLCFIFVIWFKISMNIARQAILSPLYGWGSWGSERLIHLPMVTQSLSASHGFQPKPVWFEAVWPPVSTIISSSKYLLFGILTAALPPTLTSGNWVTIHFAQQCRVQNSLRFNNLLCIYGMKSWVYHPQARYNNSPGKRPKQVHIPDPGLSLLGSLLKPSLLVTYWAPACPSRGRVGSRQSRTPESARPWVIH